MDTIYIPGEIEKRSEEKAAAEGIEIGQGVYQDLVLLAQEYGVDAGLLQELA